MKKKEVKYMDIKTGEFFKYYGILYRKEYGSMANPLTGRIPTNRYFWDNDNVIPIIITIKVKEK